MLLDQIKNQNTSHLKMNIRRFLDHTAAGDHTISLERMAECQADIAMELSDILLDHQGPQGAWETIIKILRLLPWCVDPENAETHCVNRYFGGLDNESPEDEQLFNDLATMAHEKQCWAALISHVQLRHASPEVPSSYMH